VFGRLRQTSPIVRDRESSKRIQIQVDSKWHAAIFFLKGMFSDPITPHDWLAVARDVVDSIEEQGINDRDIDATPGKLLLRTQRRRVERP